MCVAIWMLEDHPIYGMILAHNRDELYSRKTYPVHWWEDKIILGGRDGKEGGTWLALSSSGRLAFVTNIRESLTKADAVTRGQLPLQFLQNTLDPGQHIKQVALEARNYNGFNLLVADLCSKKMACYSHSLGYGDHYVDTISSGVHGVSNGVYECPWPKVEKGKEKLREILHRYPDCEIPDEVIVKELLMDKTLFDDSMLPKTGVTLERERQLSPLFVSIDADGDHYGTMCMTVITIRRDGLVSVYEKYATGTCWKDHKFEFRVPAEA